MYLHEKEGKNYHGNFKQKLRYNKMLKPTKRSRDQEIRFPAQLIREVFLRLHLRHRRRHILASL